MKKCLMRNLIYSLAEEFFPIAVYGLSFESYILEIIKIRKKRAQFLFCLKHEMSNQYCQIMTTTVSSLHYWQCSSNVQKYARLGARL